MNESETLTHLLDTQREEYDSLGKKIALLDQNDSKFAGLTNSRNRIARSIIATISLIQDPKRQNMSLNSEKSKKDVARIVKEILDDEKYASPEKTLLMNIKDGRERIAHKRSLMVFKSHGGSARKQKTRRVRQR
ncbi:MAG: hypothetical protein ACRECH_02440 [Nitrososphaerales archaeon]